MPHGGSHQQKNCSPLEKEPPEEESPAQEAQETSVHEAPEEHVRG